MDAQWARRNRVATVRAPRTGWSTTARPPRRRACQHPANTLAPAGNRSRVQRPSELRADAQLSRIVRLSGQVAKVRVAGSSPVIRSNKAPFSPANGGADVVFGGPSNPPTAHQSGPWCRGPAVDGPHARITTREAARVVGTARLRVNRSRHREAPLSDRDGPRHPHGRRVRIAPVGGRRERSRRAGEGAHRRRPTRPVVRHRSTRLVTRHVRQTRSVISSQLVPFLGDVRLADLTTEQVDGAYHSLREKGGAKGKPLTAGTVKRAHAVLHSAVAQAMLGSAVGQPGRPRPTRGRDAYRATPTR